MGVEFKAFGVSIKGKNKILNQDYFLTRRYKNTLILICCDGLGSKRFSNLGSKLLASSAALILKRIALNKNNLNIFESSLKTLWQEKILCYTQEFNECSSTFLCGFVYDEFSYFGRVGDGAIAIFGNTDYLLQEEEQDFSNITYSFGDKDIEWLILKTQDINSIALCSDGITEFVDRDRLMDFFKEYINEYKDIHNKREIKRWLKDLNNKGFKDDKTLVVAYRN